jgi:acyl phosphate:glycerol-3-phosphate acyltransferase
MFESGFVMALCIAYLLGSINSAMIVCRLMNLPSPQEAGSNNPGATNVLRLGGKKAAIATLLGDALKGLLPLMVFQYFDFSNSDLGYIALMSVIGHIFPIFFDFKGGKGVATMLGCALGLNPSLGLIMLVAWLITAKLSSYASLASLVSAVVLVVLSPLFLGWGDILPLMGIAGLVFWRHSENIQRLKAGTERPLQLK